MNSQISITKQDYETPRKDELLLEWIQAWQRRLESDAELSKEYLRRTGLWSRFACEAFPIACFMKAWKDWPTGATVTLRSGNQSFDAEVSHTGRTFFIEVTSTTDVVDAYQREYLDKHSMGPGDPVGIASGADLARARNEGFPKNTGQAIWGNSAQEKELTKAIHRLKSKIAKKNYPAGTILIIHCADRILDQWTPEKIKSWLAPRLGVGSPTPFDSVWLTMEDEHGFKLL